MRRLLSLFLLTLVSVFSYPLFSYAGTLAEVQVLDRTTGEVLPVHQYRSRLYVAGEPGHQYELYIRSRSSNRLLAVTSVDGVNVVSGQTAAKNQRGYVLDGYDSVSIEGWRKNLDEVATFYFTRLADSYAARTGRPDNVGVIGVALFPEQPPCCAQLDDAPVLEEEQRSADARGNSRTAEAPASSAPAQQSADAAKAESQSSASRLGTGHGHRESSPAQYVDFRRASPYPYETIAIYYDSYRNLVAQGVIPSRARVAQRPNPFPSEFVSDP